MNPDWLRPEWRLDHPSYWAPCADPSLWWQHPFHPTGLEADGTLSRVTRHHFSVDSCPHRLDGPAVLHPKVGYEFYVNGLLHRVDGPARNDGNWGVEFYVNGLLHRLDGPALFMRGAPPEWWVNGIRLPDNPTDLDILGALL